MGRLPSFRRRSFTPVKTFTIPKHDVDRAITDSAESGFVTIHAREGSERILGATSVARHTGEMINEITLAMVTGVGLRTLGRVTECAHACDCSWRAGPVRFSERALIG